MADAASVAKRFRALLATGRGTRSPLERDALERILLIEDDTSSQLLFRNRLQELGYEVVVAGTGARGLMEARAGRFDLYLVDIGLGSGIDGYEVCRRLKGMPRLHGTPVVLVSGQVKSQEDLHRGYEAGCEAYLVKGDLTQVEDVVRAMLRIKSLQHELALQNRMLEERNRHLKEQRERGAELESALLESGAHATVFRDLAAGKPDGTLLVDAEGVVRMTDRGAQEILGRKLEGEHLADLAPGTGLEAYVRDVHTAPHEAFRFDLEWANGSVRSLSATVIPTVPVSVGDGPGKVVLLSDATKRKLAAEALRIEGQGILRRELGPLVESARATFHPGAILGHSEEIQRYRARVAQAAALRDTVLLVGAPGSGKSFAARCIHYTSGASGPLLSLNCAALQPELLERELFGYAKDAFPDAVASRPGLFQLAQQGSVFLEEIGSMSLELQERVLKVLESHSIQRLGSTDAEPVDVRLIAGSSTDLADLVAKGRFLPELFAQLSVLALRVPELGKGHPDLPLFLQHFLSRFAAGRELEVSSEALWVLSEYDWPGNFRELAHCVEVACAQSEDNEIGVSAFPPALFDLYKRLSGADSIPSTAPAPLRASPGSSRERLAQEVQGFEGIEGPPSFEAYEKRAILHALRETGGDKLAAARLLQIGKSTFYRKLKTHGLS